MMWFNDGVLDGGQYVFCGKAMVQLQLASSDTHITTSRWLEAVFDANQSVFNTSSPDQVLSTRPGEMSHKVAVISSPSSGHFGKLWADLPNL